MSVRWVPRLLVLWDLMIATAVATVAVQYRDLSWRDVLPGVAMAAALIARRFAPIRVFALVTVLVLVQVAIAEAVPAAYDVALVVAMAAVVVHSPARAAGYVCGAIVAAAVVTASMIRVDQEWSGSPLDYPYLGEQVAALGGCGALWLFAYVFRTSRERAASAEREADHLARLAAADERAFIARELHDVVAHSLAVMIAQADGASYVADPGTARAAMRTVAATGREALDDMHRIVAVLRDTGDDDPQDRRSRGLEQLGTLAERARTAGLGVEVRAGGDTGRLSAADELTVFRIVQESLTNALRHAGAGAKVLVALAVEPERAVLEVSDDGGGRPSAPAAGGGNGLLGMRERVAVHGGELTAGPAGGGWRVRAVISLREAQ
ncbi:two-component sensor histidine kinase [Actinoplanes philippinensis]|uniref:histidine kinase n=1 Tax=Actinoplanes philippinensis TaxID=35752 RepID=A0A1I2E425_9ACTN|nr:histidine kinase [Actinoplanes philippinensis]GIE77275.1 two-component sensor histidine kinase [Actinoplanes philippinensis]SFE87702.1 Histidine kinase [Actinoplanes philippinensis]